MSDSLTLNEAAITIHNLQEAVATLEDMAREDHGWDRIVAQTADDVMTVEGRRRISDMCEVMTIANPLIKRGFMLRYSYVWGSGHTIAATPGKADKAGVVNKVVQEMLDDPRNASSLRSVEAIEMLERWLYTHGAVVLLLDTDPATGQVVVRQEDPDHITDHITDPEDSKTVRYWKRQYQIRNMLKDGRPGARYKTVTVWHPDVDYQPSGADRIDRIGPDEVRWDQPLIIRCVNTPATAGFTWGIGDAYAAVPWARMSKEFLEAWFTLMQALARFAWRTTSKNSRAARAAAMARREATNINPAGAGAHAFMDTDTTLEAIPKTGATIDAYSAQPLQQFVAAALDVPLTMLLGDPGTSGARAVAETLDQPMELAMSARRAFWAGVLRRICEHRIDAAVIANSIPSAEMIVADGRRTINLPEGWLKDVTVDWPSYDSTPVDTAMTALRDADGLDKLPPLLIAQLAMKILGVDDPDEWLKKIRDADGNFIPLSAVASSVAAEAARQGIRP